MYNEARENIMHSQAIKILQATIDETYRTIERYDSSGRDTNAEVDSDLEAMEEQINGLKYAIALLK